MYYEIQNNELNIKIRATNKRGEVKKLTKSLLVLKEYMMLKGYKNPTDKDCIWELKKMEAIINANQRSTTQYT